MQLEQLIREQQQLLQQYEIQGQQQVDALRQQQAEQQRLQEEQRQNQKQREYYLELAYKYEAMADDADMRANSLGVSDSIGQAILREQARQYRGQAGTYRALVAWYR